MSVGDKVIMLRCLRGQNILFSEGGGINDIINRS